MQALERLRGPDLRMFLYGEDRSSVVEAREVPPVRGHFSLERVCFVVFDVMQVDAIR